MKLSTRITLPLAITALALAGCSGPDAPTEATSPTQTASASQSPSSSPTESNTPTPSPKPTRTAAASAAPTAPAAAQAGPADDGMTTSLNEFLASGGVCFADYFPAGPLTDAATAEVQDYCASQAPAPMSPEDERTECEALDHATASSGAIQYCYMEYGIDPAGAAPLREQDPYAGLSDDELAELPVTGMP